MMSLQGHLEDKDVFPRMPVCFKGMHVQSENCAFGIKRKLTLAPKKNRVDLPENVSLFILSYILLSHI